jgi:hypothetical protein
MLIFADYLEEHDMGQIAYAWCWLAARGYRPARRVRPRARMPWAWWHPKSDEFESDPSDLADFRRHPEARLPPFVFRAMIRSGGLAAHVYSPTLAGAVDRLARGLQVLREQVGLGRQPGDP